MGTTGVHIELTNPGKTPIRLQLKGTDGTVWCTDLSTVENDLVWSDFVTECWTAWAWDPQWGPSMFSATNRDDPDTWTPNSFGTFVQTFLSEY